MFSNVKWYQMKIQKNIHKINQVVDSMEFSVLGNW